CIRSQPGGGRRDALSVGGQRFVFHGAGTPSCRSYLVHGAAGKTVSRNPEKYAEGERIVLQRAYRMNDWITRRVGFCAGTPAPDSILRTRGDLSRATSANRSSSG